MSVLDGRYLVVSAPGKVALEDRPPPTPRAGEQLVQPLMVGLCGTDLEIVDGSIDPAYVSYPLVLGHEWCGTLPQGGSPTRVVAEGIVPCGRCRRCREGRTNLCEVYDEVGFTRDGAAGSALCVPGSLVHTLGPLGAHSASAGVLVEPAAVVYQALRRAAPTPGLRILVVGDGTIGLLAVVLSALWSPEVVDQVGGREAQEGLSLQAGANTFRTGMDEAAEDYDLVVEAAGSPRAILTALGSVRRGGAVVLLGLPSHGQATPVAVADMVNRDLTVHASFGYTSQSFGEVAALVGSGRLDPSFLVTHRYPLEGWADALQALRKPEGARGKVVLDLSR